jgi:hypothetical protein
VSGILTYVLWAFVLVLQAGSSTGASRARNTGSVAYHGVAAIFSHGVWFISFAVAADKITRSGTTVLDKVLIGLFYTFFCVVGSMLAHHVSAKYLEQGKRKVGA